MNSDTCEHKNLKRVIYDSDYDKLVCKDCGTTIKANWLFDREYTYNGVIYHTALEKVDEGTGDVIHIHNELNIETEYRVDPATDFCYKKLYRCSEDNELIKTEIITEHEKVGVPIPGNDREVDIKCNVCDLAFGTIRKNQLGDIPMIDDINKPSKVKFIKLTKKEFNNLTMKDSNTFY